MATVFMKWLETRPGDYDRGIQLLTLGRLRPLKGRIAEIYIQREGEEAPHVLEIGCGTGTLAVLMAETGAQVAAIDGSESMLAEARTKAEACGVADLITFQHMDVTELGEHFDAHSFDFIVSTLAFSEFPPEVQRYALRQCSELLKLDGQLLIADEMVPDGFFARLLFWLVRLPLVLVTWLLTRTSTSALKRFPFLLAESGFVPNVVESHLGGSLQLWRARPATAPLAVDERFQAIPRLRHRVTIKTILLDLWSFITRVYPPYPKQATGLYRVGEPDRKSPLLVTGNYELTVRRLVAGIDGKVDCWLLVTDSKGINVWCAAGGGHFTAEDVIAGLKTSGVADLVDHHALILPQLCANGVDGWKIRHETGWGVHWGPVRAADIPAYLAAKRKKTAEMRNVRFGLKERLEMATISIFFYGVMLLIPFLIFWRAHLWLLLGLTALFSYLYAIMMPWLLGKDGLGKGAAFGIIAVAGVLVWSLIWGKLPLADLYSWSLGLGFLAFFLGSEFQGMTPVLRGPAGNWPLEGLVGLGTLALYGIGRLF